MSRAQTDAAAPQRIREFAADYYWSAQRRDATPAERALIERALADYFLDEEWLMDLSKHREAEALAALDRLPAQPGTAPTIALIRECVIDLAGRLDRREDANLIMRENLVMLSETINQLRAAAASTSTPQRT